MEFLAALERAAVEFACRLKEVSPRQWDDPTPCDDWSVLELIDHVVVGNRWSVHVVDGASADEAFGRALDRPLSDDRLAEFRSSAAEQFDAFVSPGALERPCPAMGDITGRSFLKMRVSDLTIHAWDLARAIGLDEKLDPDLVALLWQRFERLAPTIGTLGMWGTGPSGDVDESAPLQERLLDVTGRRPSIVRG